MMLLKSCAMLLASVPTASIFCASRNLRSSSTVAASACLRSVMSIWLPRIITGTPMSLRSRSASP